MAACTFCRFRLPPGLEAEQPAVAQLGPAVLLLTCMSTKQNAMSKPQKRPKGPHGCWARLFGTAVDRHCLLRLFSTQLLGTTDRHTTARHSCSAQRSQLLGAAAQHRSLAWLGLRGCTAAQLLRAAGANQFGLLGSEGSAGMISAGLAWLALNQLGAHDRPRSAAARCSSGGAAVACAAVSLSGTKSTYEWARRAL